MFANATNNVGISQRVVATLVACAMVLMSIGIYNTAQAADLSDVKDTLSDSAPTVNSNHTIEFTVPATATGVGAGQTITVTFPAGFSLTSVDEGDVDFEINTVDQTVAAAPSGATWGAVVSGQTLTLTSGTGTVAPSDDVLIQIGTNAAAGVEQINNPGLGSYELVITAGTADSGRTMVAIVSTVDVRAIVDTTFDFVIEGTPTSTAIDSATTTGSTTATLINFGKLVAGVPEILAQRLNVTTNARNGFNVTVETDGALNSSNGADIDVFNMGSDLSTPTAWAAPVSDISNENTWGHWALTTEDNVGLFDAGEYIAVSSTTPRSIFAHNGPSDGSTVDAGETDVAYKIQITPLQEAAEDYNTVLTYIATPTF